MVQNQLLNEIQAQIGREGSLNEAVADVLEISYDAAHRRVSGKSKISLAEGLKLSKHFGISLDRLYEVGELDYVVVEKTKPISSELELEQFYQTSYESVLSLPKREGVQVLYSAKDIPMFHVAKSEVLNKFKAYVWMKLLDPNFIVESFESYRPRITMINAAKRLGDLYSEFDTIEIWDVTTVNSMLKQVHYYFTAGQLGLEAALEINEAVTQLIKKIEKRVCKNETSFKLYYNELLLMNNTALVRGEKHKLLYVPVNTLSYYKTHDIETCNQAEAYLNKQLLSSKLLNTSGEKEQKTFFNKIYNKIKALNQLLQASIDVDFQ